MYPDAGVKAALVPWAFLALVSGCGGVASDASRSDSEPAPSAQAGAASVADLLTRGYSPEECSSCAEWNEGQAPFRIFGNTYYVGTRGLASVLITSLEGHVLIDGGLPDSAPLILENVAALGFEPGDIELILNTHAHHDHAAGIAALQAATGALVAASPLSAAALSLGTPVPSDPQLGQLLPFPPVAEVEEFAPGEMLVLGPLMLAPYSTPGHAPGGTSWAWRSCEGDRCLEIVFADSQSPLSVDGYRFTGSPSLPEFERGYAILESLPCDVLITPHPAASSFWERHEGGAGLIDPEACRRYGSGARQALALRLEMEQRTQ